MPILPELGFPRRHGAERSPGSSHSPPPHSVEPGVRAFSSLSGYRAEAHRVEGTWFTAAPVGKDAVGLHSKVGLTPECRH